MRRLLLLRHAKSEWPAQSHGADDHARPLNERGRDAAKRIGAYMKAHHYIPTLVLCSSSERTTETVQRLKLPSRVPVEFLRALYLAEWPALLTLIRRVHADQQALLLIGHNPGMGQLAATLSRAAQSPKGRNHLAEIKRKFPTGALAVLDFDVNDWSDVGHGAGIIADYVRPKELADAEKGDRGA